MVRSYCLSRPAAHALAGKLRILLGEEGFPQPDLLPVCWAWAVGPSRLGLASSCHACVYNVMATDALGSA